MRKVELSLHEFGFVVATRAALAAGIALLAAGRLNRCDRRRVGRTLLAVGVLTTPIAGYLLFLRGLRGSS